MINKRKATLVVLGMLISQTLSGCGTISSQHDSIRSVEAKENPDIYFRDDPCCIPTPNIYSGVVTDYQTLTFPFTCPCTGESGLAAIVFWPVIGTLSLIDMPMSFVADTAILPYTIYRQVEYGNITERCAVCR